MTRANLAPIAVSQLLHHADIHYAYIALALFLEVFFDCTLIPCMYVFKGWRLLASLLCLLPCLATRLSSSVCYSYSFPFFWAIPRLLSSSRLFTRPRIFVPGLLLI